MSMRSMMRPALAAAVGRRSGAVLGLRQRRWGGGGSANEEESESYSMGMKWMHWIMGGCFMGCIGTVKMAQWSPKNEKERKAQLMNIHKSLALIVCVLLPVRMAMRFTHKLPRAMPGSWLEQKLAEGSHFLLYACGIYLPVSGVVMGYMGGNGLPFFQWKIPGSATPNKQIAGTAFSTHKQVGQVFQYLVPLHIGASLFHFARGDAIFARINPFAA